MSNDTTDHKPQTVTKADIVESVYRKVGFSKKESLEIVERVFETIKSTLERGEKVKISGFGKFEVRNKRARRGRNPQTGEEIEITARRVLSFRPSQVLRNALIDGEFKDEEPIDAPGAVLGSRED
jgi:integration host factor subunit alpha